MKNGFLLALLVLLGMTLSAYSQNPPPPAQVPPAAQPVNPIEALTWDGVSKKASPVFGQNTADFIFSVTNHTSNPIVIDHVQTSCGCTVAELPSKPWVIAPEMGGNISAHINLMGKSGKFTKALTVFSTNMAYNKVLTLEVTMPQNPSMMREQNQQLAKADAQTVFRGDCAKCHAEPTHNLMGKELYVKACGICHDANPRATMVTDLHAINHPTDLTFWKMIIAQGKPGTMMPAFSTGRGGPLTTEQIDSLAKVLVMAYPSHTFPAPAPGSTSMNLPTPPAVHN